MQIEGYVTVAQAAKLKRVSRQAMHRQVCRGIVPAKYLNPRLLLIAVADLDRYTPDRSKQKK